MIPYATNWPVICTNSVFIFLTRVCLGSGRRAITGQGEKNRSVIVHPALLLIENGSVHCAPACCDHSPVAVSSQRRAGLQASGTRVSLKLRTFDFRLSEENVSGVVGNCQGIAIRPLKCFKWFLVCCYAVVRVFWKIIRWLFLPVL